MDSNTFIEITAETLGNAAPVALATFIDGGIGTIPSAILTSVVTKGAQHAMNVVHRDVQERQLSAIQCSRMQEVLYHAQRMYYKSLQSQGWQSVHPEGDAYMDGVMEACEQTVMNAINESRAKKVPYEGFLLGTQMANGNDRFEDYHMMANILSKMTWREMVLVALINEGWKDYEANFYITNPAASVEIYDLVVWGLVKPKEGWVVENNSAPVCLSENSITDFGHQFYMNVALYNLTKEDKDKVCDTLNLKYIDNPEQANRIHTATEEGIKKLFDKERASIIEEARPKWEVLGEVDDVDSETIVKDGLSKIQYKDSDQAMFDYDSVRGK